MIGVGVHLHALDLFLKRKGEYEAAPFHQVSAKPLQSFKSKFGRILHKTADLLCRELAIRPILSEVVASSGQSPKV